MASPSSTSCSSSRLRPTVNNFGQGIDFNIRGIGKAEHNTQTTTGVITYRDGVATFPGYFTAEPYYDIARVEILRGPQGTFVGQNATGGAVFVTSNDPVIDGGHHGYIHAAVGNYNYFGAQGAINLPAGDTFAARVAFNGGTARQLLRHHRSVHRRRGREDRQRTPGLAVGADGQSLGAAQDGLQLPRSERLPGRSGDRDERSCSTSRANARHARRSIASAAQC